MKFFIGAVAILSELCFFIPLAKLKNKENRCSSYVQGKISNITQKVKSKLFRKHVYYVPTVIYEIDEKCYEIKYRKSDNINEYQIGDQFWVMYNPKDPTEIYQDDSYELLKAKIKAMFGIFTIILTLLFIW